MRKFWIPAASTAALMTLIAGPARAADDGPEPEGTFEDRGTHYTVTHLHGNEYKVEADNEQVPLTVQRKDHVLSSKENESEIRFEFSKDWSTISIVVDTGHELHRVRPPTPEERDRAEREALEKARYAEVLANLKAAFIAEKAYYQEKDSFSPLINIVGFSPERGNRYSYYFASEGASQNRTGANLDYDDRQQVIIEVDRFKYPKARFAPTAAQTGCHLTEATSRTTAAKVAPGVGVVPSATGSFLVLAAGQQEEGGPMDCWTISSENRVTPDGKGIPAGEPFHEPAK